MGATTCSPVRTRCQPSRSHCSNYTHTHAPSPGVVKRNDLLLPSYPSPNNNNDHRGEVWLERAALHHLGRNADDALVRAHRRALWQQSQEEAGGAAAGAAWDAALRAHFAGRGGRGKGMAGATVGARPSPASMQRREQEEDGEAQQRAGLLVVPHRLPGPGRGGRAS